MSPSPFIIEWIERVAGGRAAAARALDVAMGRGRHSLPLARAGFLTFGVDIDLDAVRGAMAAARAGGAAIHGWCADLTQYPLPASRFDLVIVTRYLQRDLFPRCAPHARPAASCCTKHSRRRRRRSASGRHRPITCSSPESCAGVSTGSRSCSMRKCRRQRPSRGSRRRGLESPHRSLKTSMFYVRGRTCNCPATAYASIRWLSPDQDIRQIATARSGASPWTICRATAPLAASVTSRRESTYGNRTMWRIASISSEKAA